MYPNAGMALLFIAVVILVAGVRLDGWHLSIRRDWRRRVHVWGPWFLIVGGPLVGLIWLYTAPRLPSGPVAWRFEEAGYALQLEWQLEKPGVPLKFFVPGFVFLGRNISGRPLYRPDAFVTVEHNKKVVPLYIVADGQWIEFSAAKEIPADAEFQIGCQMRGDTLHCADWTERMPPEQFLRDIGGFKLTFSYDGAPSLYYRFTTEELRKQFEQQKQEEEARVRKLHPPAVTRN
jgi:hypothetical protein